MQLQNSKIIIGKIVGVYGIKGIVKIKSYCELILDNNSCIFELYKSSTDKITNIEIESLKHYKLDIFLVKIKDINDCNSAESLLRSDLIVDKNYLPKTEEDEFYNFDLIGLFISYNNSILGEVEGIQNFGSDYLLEVRLHSNSKLEYFPFTKNDILSVDIENKVIKINQDSVWINNLLEK